MPGRIVAAIPPGPGRTRWKSYFSHVDQDTCWLDRASIISNARAVLENDRLLLDGTDLVTGTVGLLNLDSGYMWPLPLLDPDQATWDRWKGRVADLLRNERESRSFWLSLLEILEECVPTCVNTQEAFAWEAMKPAAFAMLQDTDVPVAPFLAGNDRDQLAAFMHEGGSVECLRRSLAPGAPLQRVSNRQEVLENEPILVQRVDRGSLHPVWVVGTRCVTPSLPEDMLHWCECHLKAVMNSLGLRLSRLVLARAEARPVLLDFTSSPDVAGLPEGDAVQVMEATRRYLVEGAP